MISNIFKGKHRRRRNLVLVVLPFLVLIAVFGYFGIKSVTDLVTEEEEKDSYYIESMDYKLRDNATEYQVEIFNELADAVEDGTDSLKISELVAKNFIADLYTWTNKAGSYDVGGVYYIYSPNRMTYVNDIRDNFYKYLSYYIKTYGSENLLEVTSVDVLSSGQIDNHEIDGVSYPCYSITCEWTYNDYSFDSKTNYIQKAYVNIYINEDGRYEIVGLYGDE